MVLLKAGLIGLGAIGSAILKETIEGELKGKIEVVSILEKRHLDASLVNNVSSAGETSITSSFSAFLADILEKRVTIVIEAASQKAVKDYAVPLLKKEMDLLIMSTGAFLSFPRLLDSIKQVAELNEKKVYLPAGAVAGIDSLSALASSPGKLTVTLETRKSPSSLSGAPYLEQQEIDVFNLKKPAVIFDGTAEDACRAFPKNINVSATISLTGVNPENFRVKIVCDPHIKKNSHEITAYHETAGKMISGTFNEPFPVNPKTSYLAFLSAIGLLKKLCSPLQVG